MLNAAPIEHSSIGMELMPTGESKERAKAILCTIHQPTSETFQYFSHIILLYHGRCVFHGSSQDANVHFSKFVSVTHLYLAVIVTRIEFRIYF